MCCVALPCHLFDLACFFLPSHLSLKHVHLCYILVGVSVHYLTLHIYNYLVVTKFCQLQCSSHCVSTPIVQCTYTTSTCNRHVQMTSYQHETYMRNIIIVYTLIIKCTQLLEYLCIVRCILHVYYSTCVHVEFHSDHFMISDEDLLKFGFPEDVW